MDTNAIIDRTRRRAGATALAGLMLALAACSGSNGGTSATATAAGGAGAATPAGATPAPLSTAGAGAGQPSDAPAATPGSAGGGGGSAVGVCDLVTAAEMARAIGATGTLATTPVLGPPDACSYALDGVTEVAVQLTPHGGELAYAAMAADEASTPVQGVGDKAIYNTGTETFLVMKSGKLVVIRFSLTDDQLPAARADVMQQIATIAAGRL